MPRKKKSGENSLKCCICGRKIEDPLFSVELSPGSYAHFECAADRAMKPETGSKSKKRRKTSKSK